MGSANNSGKPQNLSASSEANKKSDATIKSTLFVTCIIKALKDLRLYPTGNAIVNESIDRALQSMKENFSAEKLIDIRVEKDRVLVSGAAASAKDPRVGELCLSLYKRGIHKIVLDPDITADEMKGLLDAVSMRPEEIAQAGGITNLVKAKRIAHAVVEASAELLIVEGDSLATPEKELPELEGLEYIDLTLDELSESDAFDRMFVRVEHGDPASLQRLHALLRNPGLFSRLLERLALHVEKVGEEIDPMRRVEYMLKVLNTVGTAIASLPTEGERAQLIKNLAVSVLGLSATVRSELVNQGLVPNLILNSVESNILSRFPVSELADSLVEHFEVSGAAASVLQGHFRSLVLSKNDRSALAQAVRQKLNESGMLTAAVESFLIQEETGPPPASPEKAPPLAVSSIDGYAPERVLFAEGERAKLMKEIPLELATPVVEDMVPALLELLRHETVAMNHAALVGRAVSYMNKFLEERRYECAALLLKGLQDELEQKKQTFSLLQLKSLRMAVEGYLSEARMRRLIETLRGLHKESADFEKLVRYFDAVGAPAIKALVNTLDDEESRHVRLLICQALTQLGGRSIMTVAESIDHPKWYVVRNAVSILGQIGKPQCVPHLRRALSHSDIRVRREALKGIAAIRSDDAIDLVCAHLTSANVEMCKIAIGWAAAMEAEQALPALDRLLSDENIWKEDEEIVRLAIEALASIGSEPAIRLLRKLSSAHSLFRLRKAGLIRGAATAALRGIGEGSAW
ncbi:MAG: HEAT repeat domain-containing protein [Candidatus Lindowbacteria bacterium]|nr:HEAT repeat domain-containing protein [Candidatus Lindowbacteria bacterium]